MHWVKFIYCDLNYYICNIYFLLTFYTLSYPAAFLNFNIYAKQFWKVCETNVMVHLQAGLGQWGMAAVWGLYWMKMVHVLINSCRDTYVHRGHKDLYSWSHQCKRMHLRYLFFPWSGIIMQSFFSCIEDLRPN